MGQYATYHQLLGGVKTGERIPVVGKRRIRELKIHIRNNKPGLLECVIEDNGVGRERARELKSKSASNRKSLGMRLTEDRLSLLNAEGIASAAIQVQDLTTDQGEAVGTKVILTIPIDN